MSAKRVLYFAENALSPIQGGGIVVYALLRGLAPQDVLGFYVYESITPAPEYAQRFELLPSQHHGPNSNDAAAPGLPWPYYQPRQKGFLGRKLATIDRLSRELSGHTLRADVALVEQRLQRERFVPDVVFFAGLSLRTLRLARHFAKRHGCKIVMLNMDDWFSEQIERQPTLRRLRAHQTEAEMRAVAPLVSKAVTNSPHLAFELGRRYGIPHSPLNNACYDMLHGRPRWSAPPHRNGKVICFAGALNWHLQGQTLARFSRAVAELALHQEIVLNIYTPPEFAPLANHISIPGKVVYKGFVDKRTLIDAYLDADALVLTTTFDAAELRLFRYSLATKLSDYLCAGRPVISVGHPEWAVHDWVDRHNCGASVRSPFTLDMKHVVAALLSRSDAALHALGENNRGLWEREHDVRILGRDVRSELGLGDLPEQP